MHRLARRACADLPAIAQPGTRREFEAKKKLLELEQQRAIGAQTINLRKLVDLRAERDRLAPGGAAEREFIATRSGIAEGLGAPLSGQQIEGLQKTFRAESADAFREARDAFKKLSAETDLLGISLQSTSRALNTEFVDPGAGGGGSGGGGGGSSTRTQEHEDEKKALDDLIAASNERAAQLVNEQELLTAATEKERAYREERQRLLAAAAEKGIALDPAFVEKQARGIAELTVETRRLREAKDVLNEATDREKTTDEKVLAAKARLADLLPELIRLTGDEAEARRLLAEAQKDVEDDIRSAADGTNEWADAIGDAIGQAQTLDDAFQNLLKTFVRLAASEFFKSLFDPGSVKNGSGIFDQLGSLLGPVQRTEIQPRIRAEIAGQAAPSVHDDLMIFVDRIAGGVSLAGIWDLDRKRFGWDGEPAFNTATGAEFWHVSGRTSAYADDAADGVTWRSIFAAAAGAASADAASIAVDGLLPGEVIPRGCLARIGDYRYVVRTAMTADAGGAATLALSVPLRAAVADNQAIRLPGDFGVFSLVDQDIGPTDADGVTDFRMSFVEVYADEFSAGFTYVVD